MKFSAFSLGVALAASRTNAFMAPSPVARSVGPMFSSEAKEETAATTTTDDAPAADTKDFDKKVVEETAAELNVAATAAAVNAPAPAPVTPQPYVLQTLDKSKIIPGRYADEEFSVALPFLKRPPKLDGTTAGDFGFDPFGFTEDLDVFTMQEAEIRHGRLAMLAIVGWPLSELLAPSWMLQDGKAPSVLNGMNIPSALAIVTFFGAVGFFEYQTALRRNDNTAFGTMHRADLVDCVDGKYGVAGDYGWDPLNLYSSIGDNAYARKGLREVEVSHGRMAMLGITGFALQEYVTGHPVVENSMFFHPNFQLPALVAAYYAFGFFFEFDEDTEGTFYRFRMSSEGRARWGNLQMGLGMTSSGATPSPRAGTSSSGAGFDPSKVLDGVKNTYKKLEETFVNKD